MQEGRHSKVTLGVKHFEGNRSGKTTSRQGTEGSARKESFFHTQKKKKGAA